MNGLEKLVSTMRAARKISVILHRPQPKLSSTSFADETIGHFMEITHENGRIRICDHLRGDMKMGVMVIVNGRSPERRTGQRRRLPVPGCNR
jgi:hypothetical protein